MKIISNLLIFFFLIFFLYLFYKRNKLDKQSFIFLSITSIPFLGICELTTLCLYDYKHYFLDTINLKNFAQNNLDEIKNYENKKIYWDINQISFVYFLLYPFVALGNDVSTLGFVNRFFFILFFIYFYKKGLIKKNSYYYFFIIFFPSTILYTNLGGEENLAAIFLSLVFYSLVLKKKILLLLSLLFLYIIKINLFYLTIPAVIYIYLDEVKKYLETKYIFAILIFLIFLFSSSLTKKIEDEINWRRFNLYCEDINYLIQREGNYSCDNIVKKDIKLNFFNLPNLTYNSLIFLLSPTPDRITKKVHIIQFVENIFLLSFLVIITIFSIRKNKSIIKIFMVFCYMIFIYGNLFSSPGAAIRWKYPLVFMYLFYIQMIFYINDKNIKK